MEVPQPYAEMLQREAAASGRTRQDHLNHIITLRYDNLIRVCDCGYFIYVESDAKRCASCGKERCMHCTSEQKGLSFCTDCSLEANFNAASSRIAGTGVVGEDPQERRDVK